MTNSGTNSGGTSGSGDGDGVPSLIGRMIGEYRVLREVGHGGMGTVYEAHQASLDRVVALKVLARTAAVPESSVIRFRREAQAAAKLHHAHIVPIFAQGADGGLNYYAMEFVRGLTVFELINGLRDEASQASGGSSGASPRSSSAADTVLLPGGSAVGPARLSASGTFSGVSTAGIARKTGDYDRIAEYVAHVADALDYAHRQGVIHRDVKPHNLIIGEDGKIRVSDFGLARVLEQPGLTVTGEFLGSPLYMSPEQISRGDVLVDHRTDIYSLGATLYEWLTLVPPHPGDSREQVITQILTSDIEPPRVRDARVPYDLETICLKALEKDPNRRYETAADMRDDLRAYLQRRSIRARRAGPLTRIKKFVLRNRVATMAALTGAIIVSLGTAYWQEFSRSEHRQAEVVEQKATAVQKASEAAKADRTAGSVRDAMTTLMENLTPELWGAFQETFDTAEDAERRVLCRMANGFARRQLDDFLQSERARLEIERPDVAPDSSLQLYISALSALATGNVPAAAAVIDVCIEKSPGDPYARHLRAILNCDRLRFAEMTADAEVLIRMDDHAYTGYLLRGAAYLFDARPAQALDDLEWARRLNPGEETGWHLALIGLGRVNNKEHEKATEVLARALTVEPDLVPARFGRAECHFQDREYLAAVDDLSRAIELDSGFADAYILRGECFDRLGRYDESTQDYDRANDLLGGSTLMAFKIWRAQAMKEEKAQAVTVEEADTESEPDGLEGGELQPGDDFFERYLRDRLRTDATPDGVPRLPASPPRRLG